MKRYRDKKKTEKIQIQVNKKNAKKVWNKKQKKTNKLKKTSRGYKTT